MQSKLEALTLRLEQAQKAATTERRAERERASIRKRESDGKMRQTVVVHAKSVRSLEEVQLVYDGFDSVMCSIIVGVP